MRRLAVAAIPVAFVLLATGCASSDPAPPAPESPAATGGAETSTTAPADDPIAELLSTSDDPAACAVSFDGSGDASPLAPVLETAGELFDELPRPEKDGSVFAGWYLDDRAAAVRDPAARVNIAETVVCDDSRLTLHAGWASPDEVAAEDVGVPILMYHQFTDRPEGVDDPLRLNYAYVGDFDAQMGYLADQGYYLPSWQELEAFIDGKLYLPPRSIIVTDDDAAASWFDLAVPVVDEHRILATSFVITKWRSEPSPSPYVLQRSHTHDMHDAGANGKGKMVNLSVEEIAADLRRSAEILGATEVMAYPFGHYDDRAKAGITAAGFDLAVTIEPGFVHAGADKLALPRVRIDYGMGLDAFIAAIG